MTAQDLLQAGIGRKLVFLGRAADMISISLSSTDYCPFEYAIHIETDGELYYKESLFTSTAEIDGFAKIGETVFDKKAEMLLTCEEEYVLQSLAYDQNGCIHAKFSNGLEIRSLPSSSEFISDAELWRVFFPWKEAPTLIATQNGIVLEPCHFSQRELDEMQCLWMKRKEERMRRSQSDTGRGG